MIPAIVMLVTYATYTLLMKQKLTGASNIANRKFVLAMDIYIYSVQDLLQFIGVFFVGNAISTLGIYDQPHDSRYILLNLFALSLMPCLSAKVSLDRMTEFLHKTELLDSFADRPSRMVDIPTAGECEEIGFRNATFSWSAESPNGSSSPSQRTFRLHIRGEQLFNRDCVNLIIGPT